MSQLPQVVADGSPEGLLRQAFRRSGYVRVANQTRRKEMGQKYKKGYEVRLVGKTRAELTQIRRLLRRVGFKAGKPFEKHSRIVQPIYGKAAVEWFLSTSLETGRPEKS